MRVCAARCEWEHECSFVSVQVCSSINGCLCVYVSVYVAIFPVSALIAATQKGRNIFVLSFVLIRCNVGFSNEVF